jgi:hypothetical protein
VPIDFFEIHSHAGHRVVVGHDRDFSHTVLWCETEDSLVLSVPNDTHCYADHWPENTAAIDARQRD